MNPAVSALSIALRGSLCPTQASRRGARSRYRAKMNIANLNPAFNDAGKRIRDVFVVETSGGTAPHLAWAGGGIEKTMCELAYQGMSRTWFELAGCKKCRRAARGKGVARITDVEGELIDL